MKIVFMGTPRFGAMILEELVKKYEVVLVVTQPDKLVGRKQIITYSEVKKKALELGIPVFQPVKIRLEYKEILKYDFDLIVTAAFGQIINMELINYPKYKAINVHGSLLPRGRGGAPIQRSIMNGDEKTGITIMYMAKGMDSGDIISQQELEIGNEDNCDILFEKMGKLGQEMIIPAIESIIDGSIKSYPQDESKVTYSYNLTKEDEQIDFNRSAKLVNCQIRALASEPGAFFTIDGIKYKVYSSNVLDKNTSFEAGTISDITKKNIEFACGDGKVIEIREIKKEGKNLMKVSEFLNGAGRSLKVGQKINN
ncbi:MAG: methionyl-tRNA formyltransferase [Bacilli bacterium]|nr:methionyl-tRNA formyltransferase [Bacilli bacterium]